MGQIEKEFEYKGTALPVAFVESIQVVSGVVCDVYTFEGDNEKDLGIIHIAPGAHTPIQKVLAGTETVEGLTKGAGRLVIIGTDGIKRVYDVDADKNPDFREKVEIGEIMQWQNTSDTELEVYEVCIPPYQDGRYDNISMDDVIEV